MSTVTDLLGFGGNQSGSGQMGYDMLNTEADAEQQLKDQGAALDALTLKQAQKNLGLQTALDSQRQARLLGQASWSNTGYTGVATSAMPGGASRTLGSTYQLGT